MERVSQEGDEDWSEPSLGERLRRRRWGELRVFQSVLATAAGISRAQLCEIERGSAGTTEATLGRIAGVLGMDIQDLLAQAEREGRLERRSATSRGPRPDDAPIVPPSPPPGLPPRPERRVSKRWLTTVEAAALLGCTPHTVAYLLRNGRLQPARRHPKAGNHQRRWLVAAEAVMGYDPPNEGRRWSHRPVPSPPGYLSIDEVERATGIPRATLYRRMTTGELATVKRGGRRWVRADRLVELRQD